MKLANISLASLIVSFLVVLPVKAEKKELKLAKSGVLASVGQYIGRNSAVDEPWGGTNPGEDEKPPLIGSISKSGDKWKVEVSNSSSTTHSANLEFAQTNPAGNKIKSDSYSLSLAKGKMDSRLFTAAPNSDGARLLIKSWKNLAPPATPTATTEIIKDEK